MKCIQQRPSRRPRVGAPVQVGQQPHGERLQRVRPRLEEHDWPAVAGGQCTLAYLRHQPGPHQRGFAAAGRADHRQEAVLPQLFDQVLGERLPAKKEGRVLFVKDLQATEGADVVRPRLTI